MKYIISESKIESVIREYLDDNYYPDYNYIETQWDGLETSSVDFINGVINYGVKLRFPNSSVGFHFNYSESFNIEDNYSDLPAFIPVKRLSGGLSFYF